MRGKRRAGANHPAWKGGYNHSYYRKKAFAHYGYRCESCGADHGGFAKTHRGFIVHHRSGDRTDNSVENLEVLCQGCHLREHRSNDEFRALMREVAIRHDYASHFGQGAQD